jgi:hypothetical protein
MYKSSVISYVVHAGLSGTFELKEESLYGYVEKFLEEELDCFDAFQKSGTVFTGIADVAGIKDVGGRTSGDFEVIAVEVKTSTRTFAKSLGQALGYSLFAHRCYLAIYLPKMYTSEQEHMAAHLGVGLLRIYDRKCHKVSSSPLHHPINSLTLKALDSFGYALCTICGTLIRAEEGWTKSIGSTTKKADAFYYIKKLPDRRVLFSQQNKPSRWVSICNDCVKKLKLGATDE